MNNNYKKKNGRFLALASLLLISISILVQSCVKDNFDFSKLAQTSWNPEFAAPLVFSSLSLKDILTQNDTDGFIVEDASNFLTLVYQGNIISASGEEFLPILNQYKNHSHQLTAAEIANLQFSDVTVNGSTEIDFAVQNTEKLDSLFLKGGLFTGFLSSSYQQDFTITYIVPSLKKNGISLTRTILVTASQTGSSTINESQNDIAGYKLDLTMGSVGSKIPVNYQITFKQSSIVPSPSHKIDFNFSMTSLRFSEAYGFLGEMVVPVRDDSAKIDIYSNVITGKLHFVDPKILFTIRNSFGLPIEAKFNMLKAHGANIVKDIQGFPNPLILNAPSDVNQGTATTLIKIDSAGVNNIFDIMAISPRFISYDFVATANKGTTQPNFLSDKSQFIVDIDVQLPLYGRAETIVFQDTIDFSMNSFEELESGEFVINMSNTFPLEAGVQLYLVDDSFNFKDSLVPGTDKVIVGGIVDANGKVVSPSLKSTTITLSSERLKAMSALNNKMIVRGTVATTGAGSSNVKFYSDYKIDVQLAAKAKLNKKI